MAKPDKEPTFLAYGMREVTHGKWEAFRARVPVSLLEPLSPIHKERVREHRWHESQVPDPKRTDAEAPRTIKGRVLGEVDTNQWTEKRGEREDLAQSRFTEAERLDRLKAKLVTVRRKIA